MRTKTAKIDDYYMRSNYNEPAICTVCGKYGKRIRSETDYVVKHMTTVKRQPPKPRKTTNRRFNNDNRGFIYKTTFCKKPYKTQEGI